MKQLLRTLFVSISLVLVSAIGLAQNALVINGDYVVMSGGTVANNNFLVVDQPNTSGIIRTGAGGYIISEDQYNYVKWNANTTTGGYIFPFGTNTVTAKYIPFTFNKTTGGSANVSVSTWSTTAQNMPHAALSDVGAITSMNCASMNALGDSVTAVIDRFWDIQTSAAATGDLTFSYLGSENTTSNPTGTFDAEHWNGANWNLPVGPGNVGVTAGVGTLGPVIGQTTFSPWALVSIMPTFTAIGSATICGGTTTTLSASGAVTYTWMPGVLSGSVVSVSPAATTVYTVTGTNTNGCKVLSPVTVTVTVNPLPTYSLTSAASPTICAGGSSILSVSGANTYTWNTGATPTASITVTPTVTTTYSVTGTSAAGCINTTPETFTVNVTAPPTLSFAVTNSYTLCNGYAQVLSVNPSSLVSYTWSPVSSATNSITVNPSTTTVYTVSGTASGCAASGAITATVNVNQTPSLTVIGSTNVVCLGSSTGTATVSATAGSSPSYTVNWDNGTTGLIDNTLTAGTHTATITDGNGCTSTKTVSISAPTSSLSITSVNTTTTACGSATGSATVTVTGGWTSSPYVYNWQPSVASTTNTASGLAANPAYTVSVTDANGCSVNQVFGIVNPSSSTVTATASDYTICPGTNVTITPSGGTTYTITGGSISSPSVGTSFTANPVNTTTYNISGADASGCIGAPFPLTINVNTVPTVSISSGNTVAICAGQTTTLTASGASTYTWSDGTTPSASDIVSPANTTTYTVTGTSAAGCSGAASTATVVVTVNQLPTISIPSGNATICPGQTATLTASGASTYTWSDGTTPSASDVVSPTVTAVYTVTGTSAAGCSGAASTATVMVTVNSVASVTVAATTTLICSGQTTTLTASGASTYTWSDGTSPSFIDVVSPAITTTYTVIGSLGVDCSGAASIGTIVVNVNTTPTVSVAGGDVSICSGQSVTFTVSGASTYSWTANPASVVTGTNTPNPTANPTTTTTYAIVGTSAAGCIAQNPYIVTVTVSPTPTLSLVGYNSDTICSGNSQALSVTPSTLTNYVWTANPPGVITGTNTANPIASPTTTTTYSVYGTNNGCNTQTALTVTVHVNPTPTVNINSASLDTVKCNQLGGVVNINTSNVGNGTAPYVFQWTNVTTGSTYTSNTTPSFTNQPAGTYSLLVTDAHGCVATNSGTVSTTQVVPSLSVTASFIPNSPIGSGSLTVSYTNTSTNATTYTWTLGNGIGSTLINPPATSYTAVGTYTVVLYAQNGGCIDSAKTVVTIDVPTTFIIPNIFSPNGDGVNDDFFIINTGINTLTCYIYNRWGELLFTINAPNQVWDGKAPNGGNAPDGTYFYILQAQGVDGKTYKQNGPLTLVR